MYLFDGLMMILNFLILILFVLVGIVVLMERKILGYIQVRKGPNKVGFLGIIQSLSDALKLLSKEMVIPLMSNHFFIIFLLFLIFIFNYMNCFSFLNQIMYKKINV